MKKQLLLAILLFVSLASFAQKKFSCYAVGFYNQENLFDTCHDKGKNDYEYLPARGWNGLKYSHKLRNMSKVLAEMGTDVLPNVGCAFIGVSEVENARVMSDLVAQPALAKRGMKYVHIEGPDRRGVDCALIYNPQLFQVTDSKLLPYVQELKKDSAFFTRGFLTVTGKLADDDVTVIVCHWPSRFSAGFYRESAARQVKAIKDSILHAFPTRKVFIMGDLNDDPTNASMTQYLKCKPEVDEVGEGDMYNPWYNLLVKQGVGTLTYKGAWNLFDQIVMTPNLLNQKGKKDFSTLKYWKNQIFRRDYMFQTEGKYKGSPKRTTAGGVWLNGYSDHLPTVVYLLKEKK
jgi:endonuclease/exonuclease/phosphatase family metal-dependent hydrolase